MSSRLTVPRFPTEVTIEEASAGFALTNGPSGTQAVVLEVGGGLRVLKVRGNDGSLGYVVCDQDLGQLYPSARSLAELRARFPCRFNGYA